MSVGCGPSHRGADDTGSEVDRLAPLACLPGSDGEGLTGIGVRECGPCWYIGPQLYPTRRLSVEAGHFGLGRHGAGLVSLTVGRNANTELTIAGEGGRVRRPRVRGREHEGTGAARHIVSGRRWARGPGWLDSDGAACEAENQSTGAENAAPPRSSHLVPLAQDWRSHCTHTRRVDDSSGPSPVGILRCLGGPRAPVVIDLTCPGPVRGPGPTEGRNAWPWSSSRSCQCASAPSWP